MLGVELIMFESIFYIIIRQDGTSSLLRDRLLGISSFRFSLTMIGKQASIAPEPAQAAKNQKQFFTARDNDLQKKKKNNAISKIYENEEAKRADVRILKNKENKGCRHLLLVDDNLWKGRDLSIHFFDTNSFVNYTLLRSSCVILLRMKRAFKCCSSSSNLT